MSFFAVECCLLAVYICSTFPHYKLGFPSVWRLVLRWYVSFVPLFAHFVRGFDFYVVWFLFFCANFSSLLMSVFACFSVVECCLLAICVFTFPHYKLDFLSAWRLVLRNMSFFAVDCSFFLFFLTFFLYAL